jgi:hypothetical protein
MLNWEENWQKQPQPIVKYSPTMFLTHSLQKSTTVDLMIHA